MWKITLLCTAMCVGIGFFCGSQTAADDFTKTLAEEEFTDDYNEDIYGDSEEDVSDFEADDNSVDEFTKKITVIEEYSPHSGAYSPWRRIIEGEKELYELFRSYPSPDDFMRELRAAWRSENENVRHFSMKFIEYHSRRFEYLLTEEDYRFFLQLLWDEPESSEADSAHGCLYNVPRKELLPIYREWLKSEDVSRRISAINGLSLFGEKLSDADAALLIAQLADRNTAQYAMSMDMIGNQPVVVWVLESLQELGEKSLPAKKIILETLVEEESLANYDEEKFRRFLEKIREPGLIPEDFTKLVAEAGMRARDVYYTEEEAEALWAENKFDAEDAEMPMFGGGDENEDGEVCEYVLPQHTDADLRNWLGNDTVLGETLLKISPDDPLGLFLLLQSRLQETTDGQIRIADRFYYLGGKRELLPILSLVIRHPEVATTYISYGETEEEAKLKTVIDACAAAMECELTAEECVFYLRETQKSLLSESDDSERYLSLTDFLFRELMSNQRKHFEVLKPILREMTAKPYHRQDRKEAYSAYLRMLTEDEWAVFVLEELAKDEEFLINRFYSQIAPYITWAGDSPAAYHAALVRHKSAGGEQRKFSPKAEASLAKLEKKLLEEEEMERFFKEMKEMRK